MVKRARRKDYDFKDMRRFVRLVATSRDTPTLIRRIAAHYPFLEYCSALVNGDTAVGLSSAGIRAGLRNEILRQGFSVDRMCERLLVVARALGLGTGGEVPTDDASLSFSQVDYYKILGIAADADEMEIKKAFRNKARQTHPDAHSGTGEPEPQHAPFVAIRNAYQVLSDSRQRRQYDISRDHIKRMTWVEDGSSLDEKYRPPPMPSALRTYVFPLMGLVLVLIGVTVMTDMIIRERSLVEGMAKKHEQPSMKAAAVTKNTATAMQGLETFKEEGKTNKSKDDDAGKAAGKLRKNPIAAPSDPFIKIPQRTAEKVSGLQKFALDQKRTTAVQKIGSPPSLSAVPFPKPHIPDALPPHIPASSSNETIKKPRFDKKKSELAMERRGSSTPNKRVEAPAATPSLAPIADHGNASSSTVSDTASVSTAAAESRPQPRDIENRIAEFLRQYCATYEKKDVDRFMAFFADNALENNVPVRRLIPEYRENFENISTINYVIRQVRFSLDIGHQLIHIHGRFALEWFRKDETEPRYSRGDVQMQLVESNGSFLVKKLNYQFDPL